MLPASVLTDGRGLLRVNLYRNSMSALRPLSTRSRPNHGHLERSVQGLVNLLLSGAIKAHNFLGCLSFKSFVARKVFADVVF
jgi:hypothetical protein